MGRTVAKHTRVTLEIGPKGKKVVAVAPDWPGLERGAKTVEQDGEMAAPVPDSAHRLSHHGSYLGNGR